MQTIEVRVSRKTHNSPVLLHHHQTLQNEKLYVKFVELNTTGVLSQPRNAPNASSTGEELRLPPCEERTPVSVP
jgi:hypothetical protein